ncbi:hypothetical protein M5K25_018356 [Dendrobium thyrsiflorum]|uniref:Uncharacterized protein n=1 Tax=Dendrobium thyrsiflorum TaxID=117978 RepID=A0ABD0UQC0_DENTH
MERLFCADTGRENRLVYARVPRGPRRNTEQYRGPVPSDVEHFYWALDAFGVRTCHTWSKGHKKHTCQDAEQNLTIFHLKQMVGGVMIRPIKIPWICRPGPSLSLVYLVRGEFHHLALKLDGGGMDDGLDRDLMVPLSRAIVVPGLLSQRSTIGEHTVAGHNHNEVMPFGGESPGSEGPES